MTAGFNSLCSNIAIGVYIEESTLEQHLFRAYMGEREATVKTIGDDGVTAVRPDPILMAQAGLNMKYCVPYEKGCEITSHTFTADFQDAHYNNFAKLVASMLYGELTEMSVAGRLFVVRNMEEEFNFVRYLAAKAGLRDDIEPLDCNMDAA